MKRLLYIFQLLFIFVLPINAQGINSNNYVSRCWTSSDGLPGNSVSDILQTKNGFLYFGSYEGLIKFDGFEFEIINKYTSDQFNFISARTIFEDSSGNLWIGSNDEGIQRIATNGETSSITINSGLPNNSIRSVVEDRYKNIWVGTAAGIVYITKGGAVIAPDVIDSLDTNHVLVNQLFCDSADRIWLLSSEEKGIYLYTGNSFQRYDLLDNLGGFTATVVAQDKSDNFWFGLGTEGLARVTNNNVSKIITNTLLDYTPTYCIYCDSKGDLWFGTEKGLVLYTDGQFSVYDENTTVSNASINKIFEDREHNIWVATDNGGVCKISLGKFKMYNTEIPVNAICEDDQNNVWIGTDSGLLCYSDNAFIENELTEFCKNVRVRHVHKTDDGGLLVNCYSKPAQVFFKDGVITNWTSDDGISGNKTRVSIKIDNGDIYSGSTTGLSVIRNDGSIKKFGINDGFDCEYIMCLYKDFNNTLWIGTDGGGIYLMKDEKVVNHLSTDNGLVGNVVFKIFQDSENRYWICTGSGISCYDIDNNSFCNFTSNMGLQTDSVFQMIIDDNQFAWFVSNRGISSTDFNLMNEVINGKADKIDCKFYNQNDGLKSSGANSTALSMKDKYGRIWFTMADGFALYDPVRAKTSKVNPIVKINQVQIDDSLYYDFEDEILIPAGTKHINIKYTGLSYTASERNRFSYFMEGFDNDYSDFSSNRIVSYTNLKPGHYTFYVNTQNSDGLLSISPDKVQLYQKAFFYQMPVFWIITALVVVLIIVFSFLILNQNHKKQQLLLETKIQMATVELQMAKDDSDRLLKSILPVSIADRMKGLAGEKTIADTYDNVTVLFSDIVGFTDKTSHASASDIVSSLNDLISRFDKRAAKMGVEKIKTIGDAYMAACGVPVPNVHHSAVMLKFAIGMYKDLVEYNKTAKIKFNIRIGLNTGKVIAGVIGQDKFIYDIWGDTVNVASRMESCCTPGHIRFTQSVKDNLDNSHVYYKCRMEDCDVKGKGKMITYEIPEK